jgi:hypothetical protein
VNSAWWSRSQLRAPIWGRARSLFGAPECAGCGRPDDRFERRKRSCREPALVRLELEHSGSNRGVCQRRLESANGSLVGDEAILLPGRALLGSSEIVCGWSTTPS